MKSHDALERALAALESAKAEVDADAERLGAEITTLRAILGREGRSAAGGSRNKRVRKRMSAAQRRSISERMRASWAKRKGAAKQSVPRKKTKKRRLSRAGRKAISEAAKRRWAKTRKAVKAS